MNLLVIRDGIEPSVLAIEIGGGRVEEHLAVNAAPAFSVARFTQPSAPVAPNLYVRANAWFSSNALRALAARLVHGPLARPAIVRACGTDVLAAYLGPAEAELLFADLEKHPAAEAFNRCHDRFPGCRTVDATELDPECPPQVVANFLDAARVEKRVSFERARSALLNGVRIRDPERISIRGELICGRGVEIEVDVIIEGRVTLGDGVRVGAGCILSNATIGNNSRINPYSIVDHALIGRNSFVGPFGRIRPGTDIGDRVQIGNFVEVKQSLVGAGSRINHLAFVGDATLGDNVTIGAGVITCNHDGQGVNKTQIGAGAYVGSGTELVAPLSVGENAVIGAGSTITKDAPAGKLTIARSHQVTVESWSRPDRGANKH